MAKEFKYVMIKELGVIGDASKRHKVVELGHYNVDGQDGTDKVYVFDYYFNKDGELVRGNKVSESASMELVEFIKNNL